MARTPRRRILLFATALFFALAAPPAMAGDVTVEEECEGCETSERLAFYGGSEKNSISVSRSGDEVIVTDSAGPLDAITPCVNETSNRARCPMIGTEESSYGVQYFYAFLGGGDDLADLREYTDGGGALVEGYGGHDVILGSPSDDDLMGGSGRDWIDGRDGDDNIEGEGWVFEENEEPNARAVADTIDGGRGDDKIDDTESLTGEGRDKLRGGPGNDHVAGGWMPRVIKGGQGDDLLEVLDGTAASVSIVDCGTGTDRVEAFAVDHISRDCEQAWVGELLLTTAPVAFDASTGEIAFAIECQAKKACEGTLRLVAGGRVTGKRTYKFDGGANEVLALVMTRRDAKRAMRKRGLLLTFQHGKSSDGFVLRLRMREASNA